MKYLLAKNGIFWTIQGEGDLSGLPSKFIRLAGCPVGCPQCDTDYAMDKQVTPGQVYDALRELPAASWVWVTGGEPAVYDLWQLLEAAQLNGKVAVATSGSRRISAPAGLIDFLSVSPHGKPADLIINRGAQINLVPGLNGLDLVDWSGHDFSKFGCRYVTPMHGSVESFNHCLQWLKQRPTVEGWRLGVQAHKVWGLP